MTASAPAELSGMSQAGREKKDITRLVVATSIGNAMEWPVIMTWLGGIAFIGDLAPGII